MTLLGFVRSQVPAPAPDTPPLAPDLRVEETFGAGQRLWVRGQVCQRPGSADGNGEAVSWWPLRRPAEAPSPAPTLSLETRLGGHLLQATVPLGPDGAFEARFEAPLPVARRGWRVARHRLNLGDTAADCCSLVTLPPADAAAAVVVLLPRLDGANVSLPEAIRQTEAATGLASRLRRILAEEGRPPVYYALPLALAAQALPVFALAAVTVGWPAGHYVAAGAVPDHAHVIERLRWLFARTLDLVIVNADPAAAQLPVELREPPQEWAVVRRLVHSADGAAEHLRAGAASEPTRPLRARHLPRYPLVFCHGMLAYSLLRLRLPGNLNCFAPLGEFFAERGIRVLFPQVPPTSGVAERAARLKEQIRAWTDEPVHVVAHSMGGLDARYMISCLGMAEQVRSLTTVCTPHFGSHLADWFCANFRSRVPLLLALEALGVNVDGFRDCRPAACADFNARVPDHPAVRYFSYGGEVSPARLTPVLRRAWGILTPLEGPNDGMVSVRSARWGEYLGTVHADHFAQTPDAVFVRAGEDFDSAAFFWRVVQNLARSGL